MMLAIVAPTQVRIELVEMIVRVPGTTQRAATATGIIGTESVPEVAVLTKNLAVAVLEVVSNS